MKILITGVCGFIGFNLCKYFLKKKIVIIGIDSLDNYYSIKLKKKRLSILKKEKNFFFFKKDISIEKDIKKIFKKNNFNLIFNFAAQAGVRYSIENPKKYIDTNIGGFSNILNLCKIYQKKSKIFYASSSSVYGDNNNFPINENYILNPKNIYGLTKKFNEEMAINFSKYYNLRLIGLRFFTVFGEWGRPDMFIIKYLNAFFKKKTFFLNNYGNHYRDFTYINDVVKIIDKLTKKKTKSYHKVYNICSNKPISLKKIINFYIQKKIKPKIILRSFQKADVYKTHGSNKLVCKLTKFKNFTPTNVALNNTLQWYKENKKIF
jgi:UDP-glucuronate 4-epimerase